jgi:hypothetical protein
VTPSRSPACRPRPWLSTCRGAAPRPRAGSAPSSPREQWRLLAEGAPDDATADYLHQYFEPTARAIDGLEKALAGLGLLDDALALDLREPQDYFHRVWSAAFRAHDLAEAADDQQQTERIDTSTADSGDPEQELA